MTPGTLVRWHRRLVRWQWTYPPARAFGWMALGSVSRYAAAHAFCPVVVIRGETAPVHRQVGIGIGDLDTCAYSLTFRNVAVASSV